MVMVQVQRKGLHGWRRVLAWIVVVVVVVVGGTVVYHGIDEHQMYKIVHSDEANAGYRKELKKLDSKALTAEGVIHSYTIDNHSIRKNPMGGIMVFLYANDDKSLRINFELNKRVRGDGYGPLEVHWAGCASKLDDLLSQHGEGPSAEVSGFSSTAVRREIVL